MICWPPGICRSYSGGPYGCGCDDVFAGVAVVAAKAAATGCEGYGIDFVGFEATREAFVVVEGSDSFAKALNGKIGYSCNYY